jgi:hypothetical protein
MMGSIQDKEYSARYGLKQAIDDIESAQQIAEEKYRALVGRDIWMSEINDIHQLIDELHTWTDPEKKLSACSLQA